MGRPLRMVVPGQSKIITMRCFQARFFLRPEPKINAAIAGVIGRAQKLYDMEIHYAVVLSNHLHLYITPKSAEQQEDFQRYIGSNLGKEIGHLRGWKGGIFKERYNAIPITDEEKAQAERLVYLLSHGVKEGLCPRPQDWPGLHSVKQLMKGRFEMKGGTWLDRTQLYEANRAYSANRNARRRRSRKKPPARIDFTEEVSIQLTQIPCWAHLTPSQYVAAIRDLLRFIAQEHAEKIAQLPSDWKKRILAADPVAEPVSYKRSIRPLCHAATTKGWWEFKALYDRFRRAYARASELLKQGDPKALALFPEGCFLPRGRERLRLKAEALL